MYNEIFPKFIELLIDNNNLMDKEKNNVVIIKSLFIKLLTLFYIKISLKIGLQKYISMQKGIVFKRIYFLGYNLSKIF